MNNLSIPAYSMNCIALNTVLQLPPKVLSPTSRTVAKGPNPPPTARVCTAQVVLNRIFNIL